MKIIYIASGLSLLLILLWVYFIVYKGRLVTNKLSTTNHKKRVNSPKMTKKTPIPRKVDSEAWLPYKNQQFSFMYPKTATLEAVPVGISTNVKLTYSSVFDPSKNALSIDIYSLSSAYVPLNDYVQQAREGAHIECKSTSFISQVSDIHIGGKQAKTFTIENCLTNNELSKLFYIENKNLITQITAKSQGSSQDIQEYRTMLDKIMGSFAINL